jgi:hypothetical protein
MVPLPATVRDAWVDVVVVVVSGEEQETQRNAHAAASGRVTISFFIVVVLMLPAIRGGERRQPYAHAFCAFHRIGTSRASALEA